MVCEEAVIKDKLPVAEDGKILRALLKREIIIPTISIILRIALQVILLYNIILLPFMAIILVIFCLIDLVLTIFAIWREKIALKSL